ncbi:MAG: hypothetical protein ABI592_10120 [Acidobacteriota bacterium]
MKKLISRLSLALAAVALLVAAPAAAAGNPVFELGSILSGTFQGSTPGNDLRLDLRPVVTDSEHLYDLFLEVTGKYQGENVVRKGLLRLETQGADVYVGYVPHFDATVTSLSPSATRFTDSEANAACGFHVAPQGDGFAGETSGATCAFALRGAAGKWMVELEPGGLRLRSVSSGETLRFKRVGKTG